MAANRIPPVPHESRRRASRGKLLALGLVCAALVGAAGFGLYRGPGASLWASLNREIVGTPLYLPLGAFGLMRWTLWLCKKIPAAFYQPITAPYWTSSTIVTPVYDENPVIFRRAIESWRMNWPDAIIAVIDETDTACIAIAREYPDITVIVTAKPGKRPALADGILAATTDIVVLVDSDTIFEPRVLERILKPFADPRIGGVGTRQKVYLRGTVWQRIADMFLDVRYEDEAPALTRMGQALSCLSGRTAAYRRAVLLPLLDDFLGETFFGKPCMSGEDKRLTNLVLKAGYNTYYQGDALVWSTFPPDFTTFIKQRIRWTRNSYRCDLRAMWEGWVWKHWYLSFQLFDKSISPYTLLLGLTFFLWSVINGHWSVSVLIIGWWLTSRTVKLWPHLRRYPQDFALLPVFIGVTFLMTFVKAYALSTVHHHKWLTRRVEVVNGETVRSNSARASRPDHTPFLTRAAGSMIMMTILGAVQLAAWALLRTVTR
jgi:hyaluronan synthase